MQGQNSARSQSLFRKFSCRGEIENGWGKVIFNESGKLHRIGVTQQENRRINAGLTQINSFFNKGNSQAFCSGSKGGFADNSCAMAIAIGFDNGHDLRFGSRQLPELINIMSYVVQVYFNPGRAGGIH